MEIRYATAADVKPLAEMGRQVHAQTRFSNFTYQPEKVEKALLQILQYNQGQYGFFVAERKDGSVAGGLVGVIETHIFSDQPVATLVLYEVQSAARMSGVGYRLLLAFRKWAESKQAVELNVGISSGVELQKMDRFLKKLGFRITGGNYSLTIGGEQC
ncbi:GNAT family N-acetyltransferase [Massilia sp. W12]|uniref:GNAT family N-acetyltransferase n=1 Tax=Massilia sp. W12 TaxID=3126507 RepID=UPI0030D4E037